MDHLTLDEYWEALRGKRPFEHLARQAHEHLVDTCPTCGEAWHEGRGALVAAGHGPGTPEGRVRPSGTTLKLGADFLNRHRPARTAAERIIDP